jgi:hypothetical protein
VTFNFWLKTLVYPVCRLLNHLSREEIKMIVSIFSISNRSNVNVTFSNTRNLLKNSTVSENIQKF